MKLPVLQFSKFQKILGALVLVSFFAFFVVSRRQEDKWEKLKKGLEETYGESKVAATDSPVYTIDLEGEARFKRSSWLNWWPLRVGVELHPGDLVWVADDSKVVLFFLEQDSLVTLPEGTLFHVGLSVPQMSKLRTSGGVSAELAGKVKDQIKNGAAEARFSTRVIQNPTLRKAGAKGEEEVKANIQELTDEDLKIVRNTRTLNIRYPGQFVELYADKFPTSIPVTFDQLPRNGKLWGYLWQGRDLEPQWSSVAAVGFPRVPIEKPGTFVFQALSDDELYASPPVVIRALKRGEEDYLPIDGQWFEGVRIYQ